MTDSKWDRIGLFRRTGAIGGAGEGRRVWSDRGSVRDEGRQGGGEGRDARLVFNVRIAERCGSLEIASCSGADQDPIDVLVYPRVRM